MEIKLTDGQKQLAALLAQKNPDADYMIRLSAEPEFAASELINNAPKIYEDLLKEKQSHESHIENLSVSLEKIGVLLKALEDLQNESIRNG